MRNKRGAIGSGILLVLIGGLLLAYQLQPAMFSAYIPEFFDWPWYIIGFGGIFLLFALVTGAGGLAVPGMIFATVGGILNYQNLTGDWESWSFAWALIPAGVGVGIMLAAIIEGKWRDILSGAWLFVGNGIVFFVFWAIFRQDSTLVRTYWPLGLVALGLIFLVQSFIPRRVRS